jgi:hypothetical protein
MFWAPPLTGSTAAVFVAAAGVTTEVMSALAFVSRSSVESDSVYRLTNCPVLPGTV